MNTFFTNENFGVWITVGAFVVLILFVMALIAINQRKAKQSLHFLNQVVNATQSYMLVLTLDNHFVIANQPFIKMLKHELPTETDITSELEKYLPTELTRFLQQKSPGGESYQNFTMFSDNKTVIDWQVRYFSEGRATFKVVNGVDVTKLYETQQKLVDAKEALRNKAEEIEREKRSQIAEEIHHKIGGSLSLIRSELGDLSLNGNPEFNQKIRFLENKVITAKQEIGAIVFMLSPLKNHSILFSEVLQSIVEIQRQKLNIDIKLHTELADTPRNQSIESFICNSIQELSTNAKKHGNASAVEIEVYRQNDRVILTVEDNGAGFDPQSIRHFTMDSGFGLTNIKDKIEQYGGKMKIRSAPTGNGSLFLFDIPMERFADGH
ncbi:MAG: hypothetical protein KDE57_02240 [Calditrichaeota bacterium]|nr:hypothetical protein [Calditrichota bacterium]